MLSGAIAAFLLSVLSLIGIGILIITIMFLFGVICLIVMNLVFYPIFLIARNIYFDVINNIKYRIDKYKGRTEQEDYKDPRIRW